MLLYMVIANCKLNVYQTQSNYNFRTFIQQHVMHYIRCRHRDCMRRRRRCRRRRPRRQSM